VCADEIHLEGLHSSQRLGSGPKTRDIKLLMSEVVSELAFAGVAGRVNTWLLSVKEALMSSTCV
jgi:hypothetical protein